MIVCAGFYLNYMLLSKKVVLSQPNRVNDILSNMLLNRQLACFVVKFDIEDILRHFEIQYFWIIHKFHIFIFFHL